MRYSRFFMSFFLSAILMISSMVILNAGEMESDGISTDLVIDGGLSDTTTRSKYPYIDETESNNNWGSADQISNSLSIFEIHGNVSSNSDHDFFKVDLDGGSGPVHQITLKPEYIKTKSDADYLIIWFFAFTPEINNEEVVLSLAFYDITRPAFWKTIIVHASYSGDYGFRCSPYNSTGGSILGNIQYNITATISYVTPKDSSNDRGSASSVNQGESTVSGSLDQWLDTYDWFHISAPSDTFPTELDLKFSIGTTNPDYSYNNIAWGVELDLIVMHNARTNPSFVTNVYRISKNVDFQTGGAKASPFYLDLYQNCTDLYVGVGIHAYGISQTNPNINQKTYTDFYQADATYSMEMKISADIPNNRPVLLDGKVDPLMGNSETLFEFSVLYRDQNNETPKKIQLWIDEEFARNMAPLTGQGFDFTRGVRYGVTMTGASIGTNMEHEFNFTANDGEDVTLFYSSGLGPFPGPRVDDNLPPSSTVGSHYVVEMEEDRPVYYIELDPLFDDPDPGTDFSYTILTENGEWGNIYSEKDVIEAELTNGTLVDNNNVLTIRPSENIHGNYQFTVNASDGGINGLFEKYAELDIIVEILEINDAPVITRIGSISLEDEPDPSFELDQGEKEEVRVLATDVDGDDIEYSWDIEEVMVDAEEGVNFGWDPETGDLWFIPSDGDVPEIRVTLTVTDARESSTSIEIRYYVYNINDPPYIEVPESKSTIEGEYLYINPFGGDPDLDDGDFITFSYDLGKLSRFTPNKAIDFNPNTGRLQINVVSEDMIGEWDIIITVADLYGEFDTGTCHVIIQNVNDIPVSYDISYNSMDQNLTVVFFTSEAEDEDEYTELIYLWDFGDGSPELSGVDMKTVTHEFPSAGAFSVTLRVFDGEAYSEIKEIVVTLTAPPVNPDMDGDGMLDEWEVLAGLDPSNPDDSEIDTDEDGLLNREEYDYWEQYGVFLNPNNPDTDGDGYTDGEEIRKKYDPFSPDSHPSPEYASLSLILWIMGGLFLLLALICLVLFIVLRKRNNPKMIAMPVAAAHVDGYLDDGGMGYKRLPEQGAYQQLPPATGVDGAYQQPQAGYQPPEDQQFGQDMYQGGSVSSDQFGGNAIYGDGTALDMSMQLPPGGMVSEGFEYGGPVSPPQTAVEPTQEYQTPEVYSQGEFEQQPPVDVPADPIPESDPLAPFLSQDTAGGPPPEIGSETHPEASDSPAPAASAGGGAGVVMPPLPPLPKMPGMEDTES